MIRKPTIEDVIKDHKGHFFDEDTMSFWGSKIETDLIDGDMFVTSEDNYNRTEKLYSIRRYNWEDHTIDTISFQQFKTLDDAMEALMEFIGGTNA